jgi:hypothetical protein
MTAQPALPDGTFPSDHQWGTPVTAAEARQSPRLGTV